VEEDDDHGVNTLQELLANTIEDEFGCLLWQGAVEKSGYGAVRFRGRKTGAHRAALECYLGRKLLPGRVSHHVCRARRCLRHVVELDASENSKRQLPRRPLIVCRRRLHRLTEDNVIRARDGSRRCRACKTTANRIRMRAVRAARRAELVDLALRTAQEPPNRTEPNRTKEATNEQSR
jgi:hypothetical protein